VSQKQWDEVDEYFNALFVPPDHALEAALQSTVDAGIPQINVAPNQGKLLYLLARSHSTRSILEVGTLAGYSTIWLARGMQPGGRLVTLEIDAKHAEIARENVDRAGVSDAVEVRLGPASESLAQLVSEGADPFDLVFIDADKVSTPTYLEWSIKLTRPGSLIIIDNVVRHGQVSNPESTDVNVQGIQKALAMLADDPRFVVTAIQTVGSKGYDGLALALRVG